MENSTDFKDPGKKILKKRSEKMQISKTIKENWKFRKARDSESKYLMAAFNNYCNNNVSVAIINASFNELLKFNETNNEINNMVYKPKVETINFKEINDTFEINETEYNYDLVRRFFKSIKRIITLGIGYPLIIEYKPNWTIVIAPIIIDHTIIRVPIYN